MTTEPIYYKCKICSHVTTTTSSMQLHYLNDHSGKMVDYTEIPRKEALVCKCGFSGVMLYEMDRHKKECTLRKKRKAKSQVSPEPKRPPAKIVDAVIVREPIIDCDDISDSPCQTNDLVADKLREKREVCYRCDKCYSLFTTKSGCAAHLKRVHEIMRYQAGEHTETLDLEETLSCPCGKVVKTVQAVKQHRKHCKHPVNKSWREKFESVFWSKPRTIVRDESVPEPPIVTPPEIPEKPETTPSITVETVSSYGIGDIKLAVSVSGERLSNMVLTVGEQRTVMNKVQAQWLLSLMRKVLE